MHRAIVVTDLSFGDAGKGSITDALVRRGAELVVRYNGGAQAAHTVIDEKGRCHIFHQFGSGTLVEDTETFLSRFMLVNPLALYDEEEALREIGITDAFERMHIDGRALVTTPYHVITNRLREIARGHQKHGSCGMGIGETAADALDYESQVLRFGDLAQSTILQRKLEWHRDYKRRQLDALLPLLNRLSEEVVNKKVVPVLDQLHSEDELEAACEVFSFIANKVQVESADFLAERMQGEGCTVFEGAQGVLLDEDWGFHPYTTWSKTTSANALMLIEEAETNIPTIVLGLTRAYQTRHGEGPFPTEDEYLTKAIHEPHNITNEWQGPFRAGWLDLCLLRYAMSANRRVDGLVITCLDHLEEFSEVRVGTDYMLNSLPWEPESRPVSLAGREAEGKSLLNVKVLYAPLPSEPTAYALTVSSLLQVPLLATSSGPAAGEKTFMF
ncbi:adenylosuccinate synthetase [Abditibacteriota bacterium]|nr:adenylosuccinate synthetase [Abditibacteriota bacterium]